MRKLLSVIAVTCLFASTAFAADAAKGEYGNHCAWGLTMGKQVMTDCKINWTDAATKKTYCFSSEEAKSNWAKDTHGSLAKADAEFSKVAGGEHAATTTHKN